ncbi:MAG: SMC-Scp complex subunit ScpB [Clostridiales bacterium GWF2_36_10]|nr:MAG: SMC-Scp complex subunit ScpB [Clostridiales bacterium GWF2_36_10]HAN22034.1 SMC-Scp complex subunit ScpB [Clostridiales bacterium]
MSVKKELLAAAEAILFACGSPVEQQKLIDILEISVDEFKELCDQLRIRFEDEGSGISLITLDDSFQLCTKPYVAEKVKKALELRKVPPLSKAALEVLAIVAYNQPVTRSFIEMVRGVDSSYIVSGLVDKGLIAECGTLDAPGRPALFVTTENFLRCFGLESLKELPETISAITNNQISLDIDSIEKPIIERNNESL